MRCKLVDMQGDIAVIPADCRYRQRPDGTWQCEACGYHFPLPRSNPPHTNCPASVAPPGPGDYLHRLILDAFGIAPEHGCGCEDWIAQMNQWGVDGCRANRQKIIDRMIAEAKKRHWHREGKPLIVNAVTRFTAAMSWGLAYAARYCGELVDQAIARAAETPHDGTTGTAGV